MCCAIYMIFSYKIAAKLYLVSLTCSLTMKIGVRDEGLRTKDETLRMSNFKCQYQTKKEQGGGKCGKR